LAEQGGFSGSGYLIAMPDNGAAYNTGYVVPLIYQPHHI